MKKEKYEIYETKDYQNIREVIQDAVSNYPENIAFRIKEKNDGKNVKYKDIKYKEFQYVWEELVDSLGVKGEAKKKYYPKAKYYYLDGKEYNSNVKLQFPDTIINSSDSKYIYILDAKYYSEGNLPEEYSIFKQIR